MPPLGRTHCEGPSGPPIVIAVIVALALLAGGCAAASGRVPPIADVHGGSDHAGQEFGERPTVSAGERGTAAPRAEQRDAAAPTAEHAALDTRELRAAEQPAGGATVAPDGDGSLVAMIERSTPPHRAAALRLTEEARGRLAAGEPARAIELLERAVAIDARTPYAYYFLAEAHAAAGHPPLARSFVLRAEQLFAHQPYWLGRAHALHGRLAEESGRVDEARDEYARALAASPANGDATAALARLGGARQGAP